MSERETDDLGPLGAVPATTPPPPPSQALLAAMNAMEPVRTRVPLRQLLIVGAVAAVIPLGALAMLPLRRDLHALPRMWLAAVAVLWVAGYVLPLALALLPRRGQVLPDGARAGRAAVLASLALVLLGLLGTVDAPGLTLVPETTWASFFPRWWHCVSFSLKVSLPTVVVAALVLRRLTAASLSRVGAAIGAAAGALAGLALAGICPFGGGLHVGLAHGGGVVLGALLGALWLPLLVRASQRKSG